MRPMLSYMDCYIFDGTSGEEISKPLNLGWILRHWTEVESVRVTPIFKTDGEFLQRCDAAVFFNLKDGRIFATPFMSRDVLIDWLDRPVFRGVPLDWYGYDGVCGGEKYRG